MRIIYFYVGVAKIFMDILSSYQREKESLHTSHFIQVHNIPCGNSYQSHLIPVTTSQSLHTVHFIPVTSSQSLHLGHFISVTSSRSLHTMDTSDQPFHTEVSSYRGRIWWEIDFLETLPRLIK